MSAVAMADPVQGSLVEGVGDDLINAMFVTCIAGIPAFICLMFWIFRRRAQSAEIHVESVGLVDDVRHQLHGDNQILDNNNVNERQLRLTGDQTCPICLAEAQFPVETNCGHIYCANCMITYWDTGRWQGGAVRCPTCRQQVTTLLRCFSDADEQSMSADGQRLIDRINQYNRRFSGQPLSWIEYLRDLPTILRHCFYDFFSLGGLIWIFRLRILVCFVIAVLYLLSPLDIIPEVAFGIFGLLDDLFIVLLLAIYISSIYRQFLETRV